MPLRQLPAFQAPLMASRMYWVISERGGRTPSIPAIREAIAQIDPDVATSSARTLEVLWSTSLGSRRAHLRLLQTFGYVALLLCAIGVYGITAFAAHAQRREFAIRAALGASARDLTIAMIRRELAPVLLGLGVGLAVAVVIAPHLFADAFDISPLDAASYILAACLLLGTAALASSVPIRRAGAADPSEALAS